MSVVKRLLKSAREDIARKDYQSAKEYCEQILESDDQNYNALVFLGLAEQNLENVDASEKAYTRAVKLAPANPLALQGLANLYAESNNDDGREKAWERLRWLYKDSQDSAKCLEISNKLIDLHINAKQPLKAVTVIKSLTDDGTEGYRDACAGADLPSPTALWQRIAALQEQHNQETQTKELEARRRRLGADPVDILREKIQKEVLLGSELGETYERIMELMDPITKDQTALEEYKVVAQKQLEFLDLQLPHVEQEEKKTLFAKMVALAQSLYSHGGRGSRVFGILLNHVDVPLAGYDIVQMEEMSASPDSLVAGLATSYLRWIGKSEGRVAPVDVEPCAGWIYTSFLSRRLQGELYLASGDSTSAQTRLQQATTALQDLVARTGVELPKAVLSLNLSLARAYRLGGPKFLPEALTLCKRVLLADPANPDGLLSLGCIFGDMQKFDEAMRCLEKLLQIDPANHAAKGELGWVVLQQGDGERAVGLLEEAVEQQETPTALYRLGKAFWDRGETFRIDKSKCYSFWLRAAKLDPNHAPVFAALGDYYLHVENDRIRARGCYTRASTIDPGNDEAVRALSRLLLEDGGQLSAQGFLTKFLERKPRAAWAWRQMGFISTANHDTLAAISHFQAVLRINVKDTRCWEGLGEAYFAEGKYAAALKAYGRAIEQEPDCASLHYQVALLKQKLSAFGESIDYFRRAIAILEVSHPGRAHLPAIQGLCTSLLSDAKRAFEETAYGECAALLAEALERSLVSLKTTRIHSLAKLLGDACLAYRRLVPAYADRIAPDTLRNAKDVLGTIVSLPDAAGDLPATNLDAVLQIAAMAYRVALSLCTQVKSDDVGAAIAGYWHDLGFATFYRASCAKGDVAKKFSETAIACARMAIEKDPFNETYWQGLALYNLKVNPRICQHALIKAIEINPSRAVFWSNLGYLYLIEKDSELAVLAFARALFVDPEWGLGWLGQGLLAARTGKDALDSLEQAYDLGGHVSLEISLQYATALHQHSVERSAKAEHASVSMILSKVAEQRPTDHAVLNLFALSLEREGQYVASVTALTQALSSLATYDVAENIARSDGRGMSENLGRILCSMGRFAASAEAFEQAVGSGAGDAYTHVSRGLLLSLAGDVQTGLASFQQALELAQEDTTLLNDVTFALSQVLYSLGSEQHLDLAKEQLLTCVTRTPNHVRALMALCALGLVRGDGDLAQNAAARLLRVSPEEMGVHDESADHLLSSLFAIQGNVPAAKGFLSKAIHHAPWKADRWQKLAKFVYRRVPTGTTALVTAEAATLISVAGVESTEHRADAQVTLGLADLVLGAPLARRWNNRPSRKPRRSIQKALRTCPSDPATWMALGVQVRSDVALAEGENADGCCEKAQSEIVVRVGKLTVAVAESALASCAAAKSSQSPGGLLLMKAEQKHAAVLAWANILLAEGLIRFSCHDPDAIPQAPLFTNSVMTNLNHLGPLHGHALVAHGRGSQTTGDVAAAVLGFRAALEFDTGYEDLAAIYGLLGLNPAADATLRHALAVKRVVHPAEKAPLLFRLALLGLETGDTALANEAVNEGLRLVPSCAAGRCLLALCQSVNGDQVKADKTLKAVDDDDPAKAWTLLLLNERQSGL
ncbi:Tetratricopeptide repeat protein 37 [Thoreauomyces humboldtii]|nr:Tetratricopeptide repeat protein 37 [Thoreauomyces humboldtii]